MKPKKTKKPGIQDGVLARADGVMTKSDISASELADEYSKLAADYRKLSQKFNKTLVISDSYSEQCKESTNTLEQSTRKYRQVKEATPSLCMYCKKVRSDDDYWERLESFFSSHADIMFSHGICPDCIKTAYSQLGILKDKKVPLTTGTGSADPQDFRKAPAEDEALKQIRGFISASSSSGHQMPPAFERFVAKYEKLLRRFNKIVSISDGYQSQLMELKTRLELMARTDLLTALANRWEMMARLESEKSRAERHGKIFSILIADIDHFKLINDSYGHIAGDRVLRAIADTMRGSIRSEDTCCRWGGEEFLIVLPETEIERAGTVAEKLLDAVRETVVNWESEKLRVTVSIGCSAFKPGMTMDDCIKLADDALYSVKATGRDRFAMAGS